MTKAFRFTSTRRQGEEFQRRTTRRFAQMSTIWSFYVASNRDSTIHLPSAVQSFRRKLRARRESK